MIISPELKKYIAEARDKGITEEQIRQELLRVERATDGINQAFSSNILTLTKLAQSDIIPNSVNYPARSAGHSELQSE